MRMARVEHRVLWRGHTAQFKEKNHLADSLGAENAQSKIKC